MTKALKKMRSYRVEAFNLRTMLAVAEAGGFHKASALLNVGQSAITRRVQKLEDALGVSLFERHPTGARLTRAGAAFAARAFNHQGSACCTRRPECGVVRDGRPGKTVTGK